MQTFVCHHHLYVVLPCLDLDAPFEGETDDVTGTIIIKLFCHVATNSCED